MKQIETKQGPIHINDLFRSAENHIAKFAEMQVHLYRQDPSMQDYFHALDIGMLSGPRSFSGDRSSLNSLVAWSFRAADKGSQIVRPKKIKTDILFCPTPYFNRKTEVRLLTRTLLGLAQTGAQILCLLPAWVPFRQELETQLTAIGRRKQVTFLDPEMPFNPVEGRMRSIAARLRARSAHDKTIQILEPYGLDPAQCAFEDFERPAEYIEAWERLAPSIEFEVAVARCHWYSLCSSVCRTAMQRGKPAITFQQGVITHTTDFPITASKFVAFGAPSTSVLAEGNRRFFDAVGVAEPAVEYVNAGSIFDTVVPLSDQFALQTVLFIDLHSVPSDPFGGEGDAQALLQLAKQLIEAKVPMRRLLVRPHPHLGKLDLEACLKLVREHRDVCELSHPIWSLEDDLRRSSVVVGNASGVLTVSSASGLPTIFLQTENGYRTRDLECFSPEQTLLPDAAFREVSRLLADSQFYAEARNVALRNGSEYYAGGCDASLDGAFFSRLLGKDPATHVTSNSPK